MRSNYESFRRSLRLDGKHWDFETKEELKILMTGAGYRTVKDKGVLHLKSVSDKQLDFAWKELSKVAIQETIDKYIVHTYNKRIVKRAIQDQTINGKLYRKGQFLPKQK